MATKSGGYDDIFGPASANPTTIQQSRVPTSSPTYDSAHAAGEREGSPGGGTPKPYPAGKYPVTYVYDDATGNVYIKNDDGTYTLYKKGTPKGPTKPVIPTGFGSSGPTWYEQQQVALDKQRIKDAEAAQAAQLAYQAEQQKIAQSNAIEAANQAFRDAQLKSTYGTINGMAYASPKGSPFVQQLPEPLLLKEGYAANHQVDPWSQPAPFGGYTGSTYMNAQQPGLFNQNDPNMVIPKSGPGSIIPPLASTTAPTTNPNLGNWSDTLQQVKDQMGAIQTTPAPILPTHVGGPSGPIVAGVPGMAGGGEVPGATGQPQLIMAHGGEEITPAPGTPLPTLLGSPGGAPFSNPLDPNDPNNPSPQGGGSINDAINNLIQAAQALVMRPDFKAPISSPPSVPGMASGGYVPYSSAAYREGANQSPPAPISDRGSANQSAPAPVSERGGANQSPPAIRPPGGSGGFGAPPLPFATNAYDQPVPGNVAHPPQYNDIVAGQGVLNHMPYSPVLTGLSGYGATMTPNGTPVVMSNWQRSHLMPSSVSGPGGYNDYAMQVAGWSPTDLEQLGNSVTGNFGRELSAPTHYNPIDIIPAPAGG